MTDHAKPLQGIGVAITRPTGQAEKLTQLIQDAGGHVIPFPLIEIAPLKDYADFEKTIRHIADFDWIIFISSNAVHNGMPFLIKQGIPKSLQFAAIGPTTAQTLANFGIAQVLIPEGRFDSESFLSLPDMHAMQGKKVMIVRGIGGRELLANSLIARGASVSFGECYQRINPQKNCDVLIDAINKKRLHQIVVTSSEAMRYLLDMAGDCDWLKKITLCVNHARVGESAAEKGLTVKMAEAPGDSAMLALILAQT